MKRIIGLFMLTCWSLSFAQQMPQFSQYQRNQYLVNPGAAGVYDFVDVTIGGRMQWVGFDNSPNTTYLTVTSPVSAKPKVRYNPALRISNGPVRNPEIKTGKLKHAVGGMVLFDQYGAFRKMSFAGTYALHLPITEKTNISFGTRLGLSNNTFLSDKAKVLDLTTTGTTVDQTYMNYTANGASKFLMDLGLGLYLYSSDRIFVGIAADQLTKDFVQFGSGTANFNPQFHYSATAGYKFPLNENLTLMPSVLAKYMQPAPLAFEGGLQLEYKEWLWMAASYRGKDAVIASVGLNVNNRFKFGYSYDFTTSRIGKYSTGTHEIILGLMLGR